MTMLKSVVLSSLMLVLNTCGRGREEPPNAILVGGDVNSGALHAFEKTHGRHPSRDELLSLHRVFIDNEVLYREGLKIGLGEGDAGNRERVIAKALSAIDANVRRESVPEAELRRWFEAHRERYEQPARFDFEEAALADGRSEPAVRALVEKLNGSAPDAVQADVRVFTGRPEANIVQSYGQEVAAAFAQSKPGQWSALRTRDGFRAMRLTAMTARRPAVFEARREAVRRDYVEAMAADKRGSAVRALWKNYKIEFAEQHECLADQ